MLTEFNQLLQCSDGNQPGGNQPHSDSAQIWIVGSREQIIHIINEFYVKQVVIDRSQFSPMISAPLAKGKYMTLLSR
jgi:hypothetical protein